ncbi:hypothetical protein R6Q59_006921 [Mikania micrantha]
MEVSSMNHRTSSLRVITNRFRESIQGCSGVDSSHQFRQKGTTRDYVGLARDGAGDGSDSKHVQSGITRGLARLELGCFLKEQKRGKEAIRAVFEMSDWNQKHNGSSANLREGDACFSGEDGRFKRDHVAMFSKQYRVKKAKRRLLILKHGCIHKFALDSDKKEACMTSINIEDLHEQVKILEVKT